MSQLWTDGCACVWGIIISLEIQKIKRKRQCMMEHLIISSKTDREAGREVRERKIVVEKRSVDEMILVYLCVCVCRVCVWGLIRMPPVTRNTNEQNCRKKLTANERNLWLRRTHNPSETLKSLSVSVRGVNTKVCMPEGACGRGEPYPLWPWLDVLLFTLKCAGALGLRNLKTGK